MTTAAEWGILLSLCVFVGGLVYNAGRMMERLTQTRAEMAKLEATVTKQFDELRAVLYSTVGGRRKVLPLRRAEDQDGDPESDGEG